MTDIGGTRQHPLHTHRALGKHAHDLKLGLIDVLKLVYKHIPMVGGAATSLMHTAHTHPCTHTKPHASSGAWADAHAPVSSPILVSNPRCMLHEGNQQ